MARDVADAALLLSVIAGPTDPRRRSRWRTPGAAFARPLDRDLTGLRVAWSPDLGGRCRSTPRSRRSSARPRSSRPRVRASRACPDLSGADEVFRTLRAWLFEFALGPSWPRTRTVQAGAPGEHRGRGAAHRARRRGRR